MNGPIRSGDTWWQQTPDGAWLRWDDPSQTWVPHVPHPGPPSGPPPPGSAPQPWPAAPQPAMPYPVAPYTQAPGYAGTRASGPRAGFGKRLVATLIDALILTFPAALLMMAIAGDTFSILFGAGGDPEAQLQAAFEAQSRFWVIQALSAGIALVYFGLMEGSRRGQTVGKMAVGIRVIDFRTGGPIGVGRGMLRVIGRYISQLACLLGYLWMLWDDEKQTWHDKISDSVVVPESAYPVT